MSKLAAFGEVMMRLQVPGYELLSQGNQLHYSFSGTGVNITSCLAHLGHDTYLISILPDNPLGDAAKSYIRRLGINDKHIVQQGNYLGMYFLENGYGVRPGRVTYSNRQESSFNTASPDYYNIFGIAKELDIIHFCGISLAMNDKVRKQMVTLASAVKQQGGKVVFDCNYRPSLWGNDGYTKARPYYEEMFRLADIAFMNEKDAIHILGMKANSHERGKQLVELIPDVSNLYNISVIAGTHRDIAADDMHTIKGFLYKNEAFTFSKDRNFRVLDRIGTGDAFASGIIHGEIKGFNDEKTIEFATTAGVIAHTIVGDTPILTEQDILNASSSDIVR